MRIRQIQGKAISLMTSTALLVVSLTACSSATNNEQTSPGSTNEVQMTKWHLAGYMCEDGSQDPTIGHQGACSEHGGVITSWDSGNLYADCDEGTIPPEISVADTLALISNAAPSPAYIDCVRS